MSGDLRAGMRMHAGGQLVGKLLKWITFASLAPLFEKASSALSNFEDVIKEFKACLVIQITTNKFEELR